MNIINIFKAVVEEVHSYYSTEFLQLREGSSLTFNEKKFSNINSTEDFEEFVTSFIEQIEIIRHANQSQLQEENYPVQVFAKNEIVLSSIFIAFSSLLEAFKNIIFLSNGDANFISNSINDKFALRKICALSLTIISKYEQLPIRLKKNQDMEQIISMIKDLNVQNSIFDVEPITKEILKIHSHILKQDEVITIDNNEEEYSWIHDIIKIARVNAEIFGILVYTEIYTHILKNNYYNQ